MLQRMNGAPADRRLDSVDVVRGIIMILMALDHTRDYFGDLAASPTNLATATAPLFMTRWITHFCAPVFFLLTGTGAFLALRRRSPANLSRFLLTRGLWLVLLELTIMRFFWQFNVDYRVTMLTVLWALGWSMVALAALVRLPVRAVMTIGIAIVVLHHLLDPVSPARFGSLAPLWMILHQPGPLIATERVFLFVAYPLIPWIGVMAIGYGLGPVFAWPAERRRRFLVQAGVAITVGFVVLRALNVYGDPRPWTPQASSLFTALSFINTNKYPPSLLFLMMTLGPSLPLLRAVDGGTPRLLRPALIIGRVPLFYYILHVVVIHLLAVIASLVRYGSAHWMFESPTIAQFPITQPPGWPSSLPTVYLLWMTVVVLLYPCCRWYAGFKARRPGGWVHYL